MSFGLQATTPKAHKNLPGNHMSAVQLGEAVALMNLEDGIENARVYVDLHPEKTAGLLLFWGFHLHPKG